MKKKGTKKVEGTHRLEAFSDSIFAFSMTLLAMNIKIPVFSDSESNTFIGTLLLGQLPQFLIFVLSFLIIAIVWVNHHHFFHNFEHTDWKLLWYNNFLLFWVILIPFITDFIGEHPFVPFVVAMYSAIMFMVALSFLLMVRYVFFKSFLLDTTISYKKRKREFQRTTFPAVLLYAIATFLAFWSVTASLIICFFIPIFYFVPSVLQEEKKFTNEKLT
jgi:uncharacterized membrane protein